MSTTTTTPRGLADAFSSTPLLDMTFVMDATGSMGLQMLLAWVGNRAHDLISGSYIAAAQQTIADIVRTIVAAEKSDVRFALVAYRDHPPQDVSFITKEFDFTSSLSAMQKNLATLSANGGGKCSA